MSYSPKIQRSKSFKIVSAFVSITPSESVRLEMKPQLELRVKAHLKRTIIILNVSVLVPSCCRGSQKKCVTLSKSVEHSEQARPMPEFSDRAADGTRVVWSQSSGPGAPSCILSGRRRAGVFQSAGLWSLKFDVAFILFAWVGSNLMKN